MNAKEILMLISKMFLALYGGSVLFALILTGLIDAAPVCTYDLIVLLLNTLFICLTCFVFYSAKDISRVGMIARMIIHFHAAVGSSLFTATYLGWISCQRPIVATAFVVVIGCVYAAVFGRREYQNKKDAEDINKALGDRFK